jgi:hypothetical protein
MLSSESFHVTGSKYNAHMVPGRIDYNEDVKPIPRRFDPLPKQSAPIIPSGPEYDDVDGGIDMEPAARPTRTEDGSLVFEGRWRGVFTPNVTPEEMFRGGAFGGGFFW